MQVLGMPGSVFKVDLPKKENGVHYNGDESVDFLVRTNMGSDFKAAIRLNALPTQQWSARQTIDCLNNC
jgi:DNA repair ATPase RecN